MLTRVRLSLVGTVKTGELYFCTVQKSINRKLEYINTRIGMGTIKFGIVGFKQNWKTKFGKHSSPYTTNWDELLFVL